ncbi:thioredoxin [Halanaerobiaceae bacterium Z-7014]|uniref:Thioredoxin n=1 Tax=Halonatronomonas betaini TaxID=2778430 RepID=A0A931AU19_9FIRM|nr:thioredoxin domain-containing protein [Halonatronomonas betaini]MBF8437916.1 thioredoxin [Halonatronomonas betaini]
MLELNKENFDSEVLESDGIVVVDFWSESCDPCKELMPEVEKLAEEYGDKAKFAKLNIKGNRRLAMKQQVMGLPSIVFYVDGEKTEHLSGDDLEPADIEATLNELLG